MPTITAIIPAKNEENNIKECIESVMWCDEILVLLTGTDNTARIASQMGARIIEYQSLHDPVKEMQIQFNSAVEKVKSDWILRIDADERVTPQLQKEIIQQIYHNSDNANVNGFMVRRSQYFWGGYLRGGDWFYDMHVRLFRAGTAKYEPVVQVHEQLSLRGVSKALVHPLLHFSHPTLFVAFEKFNNYTSLEARQINLSYQRALLCMIMAPTYVFFRWLIWNAGFRDGVRGVVAASCRAIYEFLTYAKYIESLKKQVQVLQK